MSINPLGNAEEDSTCGAVWGTACPETVQAPTFDHDAHPTAITKLRSARAARTEPAILGLLAQDRDPAVRAAAVTNPSCPPLALCDCVNSHYDDAVLMAVVAMSAATPIMVLQGLARHPSAAVRAMVAANPSTPAATLDGLKHGREGVRRAAQYRSQSNRRVGVAAPARWNVSN